MSSQILKKAREFETEAEKKIEKNERPAFHLTPRTGWMNDPNGFSYYKGEYHLFYQYHPYDTKWGPMHWGHAVSTDLLHWEYLPVALAPDEAFDREGCFSGSALTLPDGRHLLMYTGVRRKLQDNGVEREVQAQCLALGDGIEYEKYPGNPVLDEKDLPEGGSRFDFRDPKMWQKKDGTYACVAANRGEDGNGQLLLFSSPDGLDWSYEKVLFANDGRFGTMWECPDFFELDGKWVLLISPMEMLPKEMEYHNGNGTLCVTGSFDERTDTFQEETDQAIDYGIEFYAPQTMRAPDGRRIMIGWMQNWDTLIYSREQKWFGQMSIPRELSYRSGRLYQRPVRELDDLRQNQVEYHGVPVSGEVRLNGIRGRRIDMELSVYPAEGEELYRKFAVRFAQDEIFHTAFSFRPAEAVLKVDRKFSGTRKALIHQRRCRVSGKDGRLKLRLILDQFSVEAFINDGEQVMTATMYTPQEADGISFFADGKAVIDVVKYDLVI
ncbi:MAG: glycoside hydrolase family 32 protein [Lachnospiraceae bacterium]|nr:glycoside hydrolase family 32 protein [Lachnospiraceae bacterium]